MDSINIKNKGNIYVTSGQMFTSESDKRNREIITKFNNIVSDDDIVIHCGNFGDYSVLKYLNGSKHYIVLGEQEREDMKTMDISFDSFFDILITEYGFSHVYERVLLISTLLDGYICSLHDGCIEIIEPVKDEPTLMRKYMIYVDLNVTDNLPMSREDIMKKFKVLKDSVNKESERNDSINEDKR